METNQNCEPNQWKIYGRRLKDGDKESLNNISDIQFGDIVIEEQISNLRMGPKPPTPQKPPHAGKQDPSEEILKNTFGLPVSANLAIRLIANAYAGAGKAADALKKIELLGDNKELYAPQFRYLADLLSFNYGVTFDKTVLLKILGQPNCEGLRCYLCKRPNDYNDLNTEQKSHFSLVMVGVDSEGFDLNYEPAINISANVATKSMVAEYGYPPTGKSFDLIEKVKNKHYTLLNYAVPDAVKNSN